MDSFLSGTQFESPPFSRRNFSRIDKLIYNELNEWLKSVDEAQALGALMWEVDHKRRAHFMTRIYQRYNKLRQQRERAAIGVLALGKEEAAGHIDPGEVVSIRAFIYPLLEKGLSNKEICAKCAVQFPDKDWGPGGKQRNYPAFYRRQWKLERGAAA